MIRLTFILLLSIGVFSSSVKAEGESTSAPSTTSDTASSDAEAQRVTSKLDRVNMMRGSGNIAATVPSSLSSSAGSEGRSSVSEQDLTSTGIKMAQSLGFILALLLVGAWAYKKYVLKDAPISSRRIRIVERMMIGPRSSLMLVEVEGKKILVGTAGQNISFVDVSSSPLVSSEPEFVHTLTEELK